MAVPQLRLSRRGIAMMRPRDITVTSGMRHHRWVDDGFLLSADRFRYWAVDFARNEIVVVTADGKRHFDTFSTEPWLDSPIERSVFDWERWWVISTTRRGDTLISEAYSPTNSHKGRPAVYLDQNHWSKVAWAMVDPKKVKNTDERDAARRIIELASDAGIILPLSSSHFVETYPLYGDLRYNVGLAMAQLSAGWELRHPLPVWSNELAVMLATNNGVPAPAFAQLPVITTEPQAFLRGGVHAYEIDTDWELLKLALSEPSVTLSLLIDTESSRAGDVSGWIQRNQAITEYFAGHRLSDRDRSIRAAGFFWTDNFQILADAAAQVGVRPTSFAKDGMELLRQIESMPFVSNLAALFRRRYLDRQTRWKANDLMDMMFLSCAAAYCDYVAAERHTGTQLRQIMASRDAVPNTFVTLTELVEALDRDGVKTATETTSDVVTPG